MANSQLDNFLQEGIQKYSEAYDAILFFRDQMARKLESIATERKNWGKFIPRKRGNIAEGTYGKRGGWGYWVYAFANGSWRPNVPGIIEYGIWWNVPKIEERVILYANIHEGPEDYKCFDPVRIKAPIRFFSINKATRLYIVPNAQTEIRGAFDSLITALLKQL